MPIATDPLADYGNEIASLVAQIAAATAAGLTTKAATLQSELNGRVAGLITDPGSAYSAANDRLLARRWSTGGVYELSVAELRANLVAYVNVTDYGATGDGSTDDTTAIQSAATAAAGRCLVFPPGTYRCTAAITLGTDTEVVGFGEVVVQSADATISLFSATAKNRVRIRGIHFKYTASGSTTGIAGVYLNGCTHCVVEGCRFEAMQWAGVYLVGSTYCVVRGNHVHGHTGTGSDSGDVNLRGNSSHNLIEGNRLLGGATAFFGVLVQDADGLSTLQYNVIRGNRIEVHKAYGICCYQTTALDQHTLIEGNVVRDIDGSANAGTSGTGIYVQTAGGCIVTGNHVSNCCVSTSSGTNSPAGISISWDIAGAGSGLRPCVVANNNVDTTKYSAINVSGSPGCVVAGNYARSTDTTSGRGIYVDRSINVAVTGNRVVIPNAAARSGIQVFTNDRNLTGIVVSDNVLTGGNDALIQLNVSGAFTITAAIDGNNVVGSGASAIALLINGGLDCSVTGNHLNASSVALSLNGCTGIRGAGNVLRSTSSVFTTAGTCSGNVFDQSNDFGSSGTRVNNAVAGSNVEFRNNGVVGSGSWQVGDRIEQTTPAVGSPKGWRCTVAGSPGTWVSEGNL